MYEEIKRIADEAIAVQNKIQMEAALQKISTIAGKNIPVIHAEPEHHAAKGKVHKK